MNENKCEYSLSHIGGECVYCERDRLRGLLRRCKKPIRQITSVSLNRFEMGGVIVLKKDKNDAQALLKDLEEYKEVEGG